MADMENVFSNFTSLQLVNTLMLRHQKFYCTHTHVAVPCMSCGCTARVKASSPESTTTTARLCTLRGLPGPRLGHFFGGSIDSELEASGSSALAKQRKI